MCAVTKTCEDAATSDEDGNGHRRPTVGTGVVGVGAPLSATLGGRRRTFCDGAGLCSPGRWRPECRTLPAPWLKRDCLLMSLRRLVSDNLDVKITGSGSIYYIGNPYLDIQITGSGKVVDANVEHAMRRRHIK